jgi:hypothetical protein
MPLRASSTFRSEPDYILQQNAAFFWLQRRGGEKPSLNHHLT